MINIEQLNQIRPAWLTAISIQLAIGENVREGFLGQLDRFFDLLINSMRTGDPSEMDPILGEWISARTEIGFDPYQSELSPVLTNIFLLTQKITGELLNASEAVAFDSQIISVLAHCLEYVSTQETRATIQRITDELNQARSVLEKLEKSKSDFISIAAHELKTPLTLIDGYASILAEGENNANSADIDAVIRGIKAGTDRLNVIINDMIDVSLIDNNLLTLNFQPTWVNRLLELVRRDVVDIVKERNLRFTVVPFRGSDEMLYSDSYRLYQAFLNIITNAIKFTPDGGSIFIDGRILPGFIEVVVSDTGVGIDPENHPMIFEKFGMAGNSTQHSSGKTKFKGGGPGLGLPIAKGIIEAHGGTIWVESAGYDEVNFPGSKFHILIPIRKTPPDDQISRLFHTLTGTTR